VSAIILVRGAREALMQYRLDRRSGNSLSVLGFGCMRLPGMVGRPDLNATERLFSRAIAAGVNYFDTAYVYPGSEDAVGQVIERCQLHDKIFIATKLPHGACKDASDFDRIFETQKKRLRTQRIDYYLIHNVSERAQWQRVCALGLEGWLARKKASGEIGRVGFSFHGARGDFAPLLDAYDWDFTQIQYNYMNTSYQAGTEGLRNAARRGLPVIVMEPLLGGKLATGLPRTARAALRAHDPNATDAAWALRWIWDQEEPTLLLSGMSAMEQLEENLALADTARVGMMGQSEKTALEAAIAAIKETDKVPCTGCNYCMPCRQAINIPACFTAYNASFALGRVHGITSYLSSAGGLSRDPRFASRCVECGVCESRCPQHIPIRASLKDVTRRLEPFGLKPLLAAISRLMR
jgi:uncharacterized protein